MFAELRGLIWGTIGLTPIGGVGVGRMGVGQKGWGIKERFSGVPRH